MVPIIPVGKGNGKFGVQALARGRCTIEIPRIQQLVRRELITAAASRVYRDAFSSPTINEVTIDLSFDAQRGDLLPKGSTLQPGQQAVTIQVGGNFDANQIILNPDQVKEYRLLLRDRDLPANVESILKALLDLDGKPIRLSEPSSQLPALQAAGVHPDLLPDASSEDVEAFKTSLSKAVEAVSNNKMTTLMAGLLHWELGTTGLLEGILTIDSNGSLIATELFLPSLLSPKGTSRRTGVQTSEETRVPVVLYSDNLIYFESSYLSNMRQHALLRALERSGETACLSENPYLLDFAFNRNVGGLLLDLSFALSDADPSDKRSIRLNLIKDAERGYRFESSDSTNGEVLAVVDVNVTLEKDNSFPFPSRQKKLIDYQVIDGSLPQEVVEGLEFLKSRGPLSNREILRLYSIK